MQALSNANPGTYTVKWMLGIPEVVSYLREKKMKEGSELQVIMRCHNSLIISTDGYNRIALGNEIADRIQV